MTNEQGIKLGEILKGETEKINVSLNEYKGFKYVDIRLYFQDEEGDWHPTKKGITVSPNKVDALIGLLNKAKQTIKEVKAECK